MNPDSLLEYIASSSVRKNIVYRLLNEPMSLAELRDYFNTTSANIVPRINELEKKNLISKDNGKYYLTSIGVITVKKLQENDNLSQLIGEYENFLNDHDLTAIPENLLYRIGEFGNSKLVQNNMENIAATYWEVLDHMSKSNHIKGISPIFDAYYPEFFLSMAQRETPIAIITTESIYKKVEKDYADALQAYLKLDNAKLYVIDDLRLAFAVTDTFASISLYHINGDFDSQTNLMSFEKTARKWGEELFEHYRQMAKEIKNQ